MTNSLEPSSSSAGSDLGGRTSWRWRFEDASGAEVGLPEGSAPSGASGFSSQSDAESWVGEVWRDLLEAGVDQVTLFEVDREVYGPMSLHPATG